MRRSVRDQLLKPAAVRVAASLLLAAATACDEASSEPGTESAPSGAELVMSQAARDETPELAVQDAARLASGNRAFACDLYRVLASESENLFFSPYSISLALAMTYAGAAGDTQSEIHDVLHFDLEEPLLHTAFDVTNRELQRRANQLDSDRAGGEGFQLSILNQAWGQKGFEFAGDYLDVLAQHYGSGLYLIDFAQNASRQTINHWVANKTGGRIVDLLPAQAISARTRLVLTNAVYFKASWFDTFKPEDTTAATFHAPQAERSVKMMQRTLLSRFVETAEFQALELPYASHDVQMLVISPAPEMFAAVSGSLDAQHLRLIESTLRFTDVTLSMPRWSFSSDLDLKPALEALGLHAAFAADADFSRLSSAGDELFVSGVFQKAFVAVDEQGTEAAAASGVVVTTKSDVAPASAVMTLDRPFLFVIYDKPTLQVLFIGQLVDPSRG